MSLVQRALNEYQSGGVTQLLSATGHFLRRKAKNPPPQYRLSNAYWSLKHRDRFKVVNEEWDTLIILDACRYDAFDQVHQLNGSLEPRFSVGSNTTPFLMKNFLGEELYDTIYITANPKGVKLENGDYGDERIFYRTISMMDHWDQETQTVLPEEMVDKALQIHREHPDKRLVVHFVQPHLPYIGETAAEMRELLGDPPGGYNPNQDHLDVQKSGFERVEFDIVHEEHIDISVDDLWQAYCESLAIALGEVDRLIDTIDGLSVVTADHGELFGERPLPFGKRLYGHPKGVKATALRKVPWFVAEYDSRRDVVREKPIENEGQDEDVIADRLEALGYK